MNFLSMICLTTLRIRTEALESYGVLLAPPTEKCAACGRYLVLEVLCGFVLRRCWKEEAQLCVVTKERGLVRAIQG